MIETIFIALAAFIAGALIGIERIRNWIKTIKEKLFGTSETN